MHLFRLIALFISSFSYVFVVAFSWQDKFQDIPGVSQEEKMGDLQRLNNLIDILNHFVGKAPDEPATVKQALDYLLKLYPQRKFDQVCFYIKICGYAPKLFLCDNGQSFIFWSDELIRQYCKNAIDKYGINICHIINTPDVFGRLPLDALILSYDNPTKKMVDDVTWFVERGAVAEAALQPNGIFSRETRWFCHGASMSKSQKKNLKRLYCLVWQAYNADRYAVHMLEKASMPEDVCTVISAFLLPSFEKWRAFSQIRLPEKKKVVQCAWEEYIQNCSRDKKWTEG